MITMQLGERPDGTDTAETTWQGRTWRAENRTGATNAVARALVSAGAPDGPWQALRGVVRSMSGHSLHLHAARAWSETDRGFKADWWRPHPESAPDPRLQSAISASRLRARTASSARPATLAPARTEKPLAAQHGGHAVATSSVP